MLDWHFETLYPPLKEALHRIVHSPTTHPALQPILVVTLALLCFVGAACGLILGAVFLDLLVASVGAGLFLGAIAVLLGFVWSVPAETCEIAAEVHELVDKLLGLFGNCLSWPFALASFVFSSLLVVLEGALHLTIALSLILLPASIVFFFLNALIWALPVNARQSRRVGALQRLWLRWIKEFDDETVRWAAKRLTAASSGAQPLQHTATSSVPEYTAFAATALRPHVLQEHLRRCEYDTSPGAAVLRFLRNLSGFLFQTFLPFRSLQRRFRPFTRSTLYGLFLSPLATFYTTPHPDTWARSRILVRPDTAPALEELVEAAIGAYIEVYGKVTYNWKRDGTTGRLEDFLQEATTRHLAVETEEKAHEAILDAVLAWKSRKEGR
ncbi:hypothetical protein JCM8097_005292 [Rhodosporidiobolus ruineniae]